jgi:hypothetical protein
MTIKIQEIHDQKVAMIDSPDLVIRDEQQALD